MHPEIACLMLTSYADDEALFASIMAGAAGYVLKQVAGDDLVDDIRRAGAGQSLLDPALTQRVLDRITTGPSEDPRLRRSRPRSGGSSSSSPRGTRTARSPRRMFLAEKTVKNYVSNLLAKLGMERRTQAASFAARLDERANFEAGHDARGT